MSLMGTLAKVAIGIAVAKGVGSIMKGGKGAGRAPSGSGDGGLLGDPDLFGEKSGSGSGLEDLLGQVLGGKRRRSSRDSGGGLGDILEQLGGGQSSGGGLGDLLGELTSGNKGGAGGSLGEIFGEFLGDAVSKPTNDTSFGDIFNQSLERRGEPDVAPSQQQEAAAALMLRAMIQAAKCDGKFDQDEKNRLLENLGEVSAEERRFVNQELERPVDVDALVRQVPRGLEQQVYLMSVMGIDLDSRAEAQYLHDLASQMGIGQQEVNALHDHLGVVRLYQ